MPRPSSTPRRSAWPGSGDLPLRLDGAPRAALVTDLVYGGEPTPSSPRRGGCGLTAVDGLGMLLHQAAPGFERWFGVRPEVDAELRAAVLAE